MCVCNTVDLDMIILCVLTCVKVDGDVLCSLLSVHYAGPQPPKWRTCSRAENSSMSSLVSTVIRQDREDKAITTVHTPEARVEDQVKVSQHVQSRAEHIGNGKNGVSCDTLDTGVDQPASPSHQVS